MSYCNFCSKLPDDNHHKHYHDNEYGFPLSADNELFERLVLEINQAGLSWDTILRKKENFFVAYDKFEIAKVAKYGENEIERLLGDAGIIRNKLKINAAIYNANAIIALQKQHGSFKDWLYAEFPKEKDAWVKLFKSKFKFVGGEIVNEFLQSTGFLPTPHDKDCEKFTIIENAKAKLGLTTP